jgi:ribonuclease P protein component
VLARTHRLRRRGDFAEAIRRGRRVVRGPIVVHLRAAGQQPTKAGFVVPRAVGSAVIRNTVKRRLRHLVAERLSDLPAGSAIVVRALPGAAQRPYIQLRADLAAAIASALSPSVPAAV